MEGSQEHNSVTPVFAELVYVYSYLEIHVKSCLHVILTDHQAVCVSIMCNMVSADKDMAQQLQTQMGVCAEQLSALHCTG